MVKPSKDDSIVVIMGLTGTGKSNLIDILSRDSSKRSGGGLQSVTQDVCPIRVRNPLTGDKSLVLVDTPGFDDSTRTDMEVLMMISNWLKQTYEDGKTLTGIIYLHRITDNRMGGTPHRNLRMFGELCGRRAAEKVALVTTMWDKMVAVDQRAKAENREKELLCLHWIKMTELGAIHRRSENNLGSAQGILKDLLVLERSQPLLLQEEMVDLRRELKETRAGKALYSQLQRVLDQQQETVKKLQEQVKAKDNPKLAQELEEEFQRIQKELDKTFEQISKLKISWPRRLFLSLFGGKASTKGIQF